MPCCVSTATVVTRTRHNVVLPTCIACGVANAYDVGALSTDSAAHTVLMTSCADTAASCVFAV
jgi:hypothetical protein